MKILLIHNFYQFWGGEDSYVISLKKLLEEKGHKVYLYSKNSKDIKSIWDKIKITVGLFFNPLVEQELTKIIKKFKPDIAHIHNIYPLIGQTVYKACRQNNIKIIQHIHNYRFVCPKGILFKKGKICELCSYQKFPFYSIIFGCYHRSRLTSLVFSTAFYYHRLIKTANLIDKYIFPSEFTRDYYLNHLKIDKKKVSYLPYFVFAKSNKKTKVKEKNYFLYVGRLSEEKGIMPLLRVFSQLPKLKLVVLGNGPLKNQVAKFKKHPNIIPKYFVSEDLKYSYIRSARLMIIPSLAYELGPLVLLESYANSTVVLVPKFSTFKDRVKNKRTGIFYEPNNERELKQKIINFANNDLTDNIKNMRILGHLEYMMKYHKKIHAKNIKKIYFGLLKLDRAL